MILVKRNNDRAASGAGAGAAGGRQVTQEETEAAYRLELLRVQIETYIDMAANAVKSILPLAHPLYKSSMDKINQLRQDIGTNTGSSSSSSTSSANK